MKKTALILGMAFLFCAAIAKAEAPATPADPKFDKAEWFRCDLGEEKESKYQCVKTAKVGAGNALFLELLRRYDRINRLQMC